MKIKNDNSYLVNLILDKLTFFAWFSIDLLNVLRQNINEYLNCFDET